VDNTAGGKEQIPALARN